MKPPIYEPKGAAKEYGDLALNIYNKCPHACFYCYCPKVLHKAPEDFFGDAEPRKDIVSEVRKQLEREQITGKLIHLCFVGDPYPTGSDSTATREIIKLLKEHGNHVQILTKGDGSRDFDLLDGEDWYGVTVDGIMSDTTAKRLNSLAEAHKQGIKTWVSFEPVTDERGFFIALHALHQVADKVKIGKLNYFPSDINWKEFGCRAEALCKMLGVDYYIKDSLRKEMEK